MRRNKIIISITIGIMCMLLTYIIFIQFKTIEETDVTLIETMRESDLRTEISNWKTKFEETNKKLAETLETIIEYKNKEANNQEAAELLNKELKESKLLVGKSDISGPRNYNNFSR